MQMVRSREATAHTSTLTTPAFDSKDPALYPTVCAVLGPVVTEILEDVCPEQPVKRCHLVGTGPCLRLDDEGIPFP